MSDRNTALGLTGDSQPSPFQPRREIGISADLPAANRRDNRSWNDLLELADISWESMPVRGHCARCVPVLGRGIVVILVDELLP